MNTKKVCNQLQITQKLLRTYEEQGIINPNRLSNNYRDYSIEDIVKIKCTMLLRDLGFPYDQICSILNENSNSSHRLEQIFYIHLKTIEYKIHKLEETKTSLRKCIDDFLNEDESTASNLINIINFKSNIGNFSEELSGFIWNFDDWAEEYDERVILKTPDHRKALLFLRNYISEFFSTSYTKVLDVGCGSCYLWHTLNEMNVIGLDNSLQMLSYAQQKEPWIHFVLADIVNYDPPETMCFHLITSSFLLHHVPYKYQYTALINMLAMLEDNGKLVLVDRMFYDTDDKKELEKFYIKTGDFQKVSDMSTEFFPYVNRLLAFFDTSGYHTEYQNIEKGIWMLIITK